MKTSAFRILPAAGYSDIDDSILSTPVQKVKWVRDGDNLVAYTTASVLESRYDCLFVFGSEASRKVARAKPDWSTRAANRMLLGYVIFEPLLLRSLSVGWSGTDDGTANKRALEKLGLSSDRLRVPHSVMRAGAQGAGYASHAYNAILNRGVSLVTTKHTAAAAALWSEIARQRGIKVLHVNAGFRAQPYLTPAPTNTSVKLLLGKGVQLKEGYAIQPPRR